MALVTVYGQGYQSPGDGGDIESYMFLSDEELEEIKSVAKELDMELEELGFDDLPREIQEKMEIELDDEWGFVDGEEYHTFVTGFSLRR